MTLPKTVVESQCLTKSAEILVQFDTLKSQWQIQPDGVVSRDILETARRNLSDTLSAEVKAKLDKYDEVVSAFNKALLSTIVVPLVDRATSNKYAHETELENECKARELEYFAKCHGDKGGDARVVRLPFPPSSLMWWLANEKSIEVGKLQEHNISSPC